ncbi:HPr family phosphocarrier protein [Microbacterium enclense]|uniref:Phosphocarrier protein HPr n=1 Tax=Microbacterium enclense TaxID=993073 RepID=A0A3S3LZQ3_9MICO|nr:dihydroxyacetone kinase phosphoryl donor subunit DhaM [Microbacterium enclense]RWR22701.1 HPr family phosphocarrier protein [Microbacterium enclense]
MIGIVAVSHSRPLAEAAVDLALQMGGDEPPSVRVAAGGPDGDLGTDATAIAEAIDAADSGEGVLVLMDLGSALLSAEMALEFSAAPERVVLSPAPFVEGLVSAVVTAAGGGALGEVAAEVARAADAKRAQLGATEAVAPAPSPAAPTDDALSFETTVINPSGLHARPAATFVKAASRYDADVQIEEVGGEAPAVSARSLLALMALGVRQGARVRVSASGPQAKDALDDLRSLIDDGFGEV